MYDNFWLPLSHKNIHSDREWHSLNVFPVNYHHVSYEYLWPDGTITTSCSIYSWYDRESRQTFQDVERVRAYLKGRPNDEIVAPLSEVKMRYNDKEYQKVRTLLDLIQVGDFVKAKSRAGDYRKVQSIDPRGSIFGQAFKQPIDDPKYARFVASDNGMFSITEVWRDGKKIWGK